MLLELPPPVESHEVRATYSCGEGVEAKLAVGQMSKPSIHYGSSLWLEVLHTRATYFKNVRHLGGSVETFEESCLQSMELS